MRKYHLLIIAPFLMGIIVLFSFSCRDWNNSYDPLNPANEADSASPVPGGNGVLYISVNNDEIHVLWTKAEDDVSPAATLRYQLYYSTSDNISTLDDVLENGTELGDLLYDESSAPVEGLSQNATYWFNIKVIDVGGNEAVYNGVSYYIGGYTITYDGNGADDGSPPSDVQVYSEGSAVVVRNAGTLSLTGESWIGWNTAADGEGTNYLAGDSFLMPAWDVILYAQWTAEPTYSVTYFGNGSDGGEVPTDYNNYLASSTATVLDAGTMTLDGYAFMNWNTAANGSGTDYDPGDELIISGDVELYAQWTDSVYVSTTGSDSMSGFQPAESKKTIAEAIQTAVSTGASKVKVATGTYNPAATINIQPGVSLLGGYSTDFSARDISAYETAISSNGTISTVLAYNDAEITNDVVIEGFTIENLNYSVTTGNAIGINGGAAGSPIIQNNKIVVTRTNTNTMRNIGIWHSSNTTLARNEIIRNNTFIVLNTCTTSGIAAQGIYFQAVGPGSDILVEGNTIAIDVDGGSASRAYGVSLMCNNGIVTFKNNIIQEQSTGYYSNGLFIQYGANTGEIIVANNTIITDNSMSTNNGIFIDNTTGPSITVVNNIIGSMTDAGVGISSTSSIDVDYISNTCFNFSGESGGSVSLSGSPNLYISTSIFSDLFTTSFDSDLTDGFDADYHLTETASNYAYEMGLDASGSAYGDVTEDIDGDSRPQNTNYDRGADERIP